MDSYLLAELRLNDENRCWFWPEYNEKVGVNPERREDNLSKSRSTNDLQFRCCLTDVVPVVKLLTKKPL